MKVEIWSDVACPWCYIGKRHFESALGTFPEKDQIDITWRSYQLDPEAPQTSEKPMVDVLAKKFNASTAQVEMMNDRVSTIAAEAGLEYHMDQVHYNNTFNAHRLIHFAATKNLQGAAKERLLKAYFTDGTPIADQDALVKLATEIGLDADDTRAMLTSDTYANEVHADINRARMLGIQGVPFFVIDNKYGISGAQPPEIFTQALTKAWSESHPLINLTSGSQDAGFCEGDTCVVPSE